MVRYSIPSPCPRLYLVSLHRRRLPAAAALDGLDECRRIARAVGEKIMPNALFDGWGEDLALGGRPRLARRSHRRRQTVTVSRSLLREAV